MPGALAAVVPAVVPTAVVAVTWHREKRGGDGKRNACVLTVPIAISRALAALALAAALTATFPFMACTRQRDSNWAWGEQVRTPNPSLAASDYLGPMSATRSWPRALLAASRSPCRTNRERG